LLKKLHIFTVKSYIPPFILTFFVVLFILLMQFLWKYIDDLVGKGLEWTIIAELMWYTSASLVPMALPLAILLSSIMTFGNLGENYELVALKSAGLSLWTVMMPLIMVSIFLSCMAFYFSNNVLPIANLKMGALLWDVTQQKPSLNLKPGVFYNGIEGYSIRIDRKNQDNNTLEGILIYDHSSRQGANKIVTARAGRMETTEDERHMIFTLYDGSTYEEMEAYPIRNKKNTQFRRISFKEQTIKFDLSSFRLSRTNEELFKDHEQMMNLNQLVRAQDTLQLKIIEREKKLLTSMKNKYFFGTHMDTIKTLPVNKRESLRNNHALNLSEEIPFSQTKEQKMFIIESALKTARHNKTYVSVSMNDLDHKRTGITRHKIEWHRKFTLSIACLLLFFVGAPLGAIIRKGGLGMPVVMSVIFFLIYHVLSITGEKMAKEGAIEAYMGMWLASIVFLPLGIFLTYKATTDSVLFDIYTYKSFLMFWRKD